MSIQTGFARACLLLTAFAAGGCTSRIYADESEASLYHIPEADACVAPERTCEYGELLTIMVDYRPAPFVADAPAVFQLCAAYESGTAIDEVRGHCDVALIGNELQITGELSWVEDRRLESFWPTCVFVRCESPPLPAGSYVIAMAERTCPFTVPSEPTSPLLIDHACGSQSEAGDDRTAAPR